MWHADAGLNCLAAYKNTFSCTDPQADFDNNADCTAALVGTVGANQTCYFDGECASTHYCTGTGMTCPGTCQLRKAAGATSTSGRPRECQPGLYVYNGTTCRTPVAAGAACTAISPSSTPQTCVATHYCAPATNLCTLKQTTGTTCTTAAECALPNTCTNGTCGPRAGVGATCNSSTPFVPCFDDLWCNGATYNGLGACANLSPAAGPCWFSFNCQLGNYCVGASFGTNVKGTCAAQKNLGQACVGGDECATGLYCNGTTCAALKAQGQTCQSGQCGARLTCNTTCQPDACYDPTP